MAVMAGRPFPRHFPRAAGLVMAKRKKPSEGVSGRYSAIPHSVLDSVAFMGASHPARSLLFELLRQHDGKNNGHLHLATSWLSKRGWASADGIQKAKREALERGLIIKTREGGLNIGPDRYALTWLPISNFVGLYLTQKDYHPGEYLMLGSAATAKNESAPTIKRNAQKRTVKRASHSVYRNSFVPSDGMAEPSTVPSDGTKTALFGAVTIPSDGNNVVTTAPTNKLSSRVVGAVGRSGRLHLA